MWVKVNRCKMQIGVMILWILRDVALQNTMTGMKARRARLTIPAKEREGSAC